MLSLSALILGGGLFRSRALRRGAQSEEILENRGKHEQIETPNHVDDAV